ncbi:flap endonuclease-1 [Candidatus Aenigmatarchaeota archaeon]
MGINLGDVIETKNITLQNLFDKKVAIDSFNWIYQFLSIIRQKDGQPLMDSKGRVTSHLSGLFYRTMKLLEANVKPVYVFDGISPDSKRKTIEKRKDIREQAKDEWQKALKKKDFVSARKYAMRSTSVTDEIINDSKALITAMGIPVIQAKTEGEALCSLMTRNGDVNATATQDYDSLLFGCPKVIRNLSITGRKKRGNDYITIDPEMILLEDVLKKLCLNQEQLITLGILVGTDFNPGGISGIGPKKALTLVKEKGFEEIFSDLEWAFPSSPEEILEFFKNPEKTDYQIAFRDLDEEKIKEILCEEHDFSTERIQNSIEKLKESKKSSQKSLNKWF